MLFIGALFFAYAFAAPTSCGGVSMSPTTWNCGSATSTCSSSGASLSAKQTAIVQLLCTGFCEFTISFTTTSGTTMSSLVTTSSGYANYRSTGSPAPSGSLMCALNSKFRNTVAGDTSYLLLQCDNTLFSCSYWWDIKSTTVCTPSCAGKTCGTDGCGGSCGSCTYPLYCNSIYQCVTSACIPDCAGKACGGDGCGGSCGQCGIGKYCTASQTCFANACTPNCYGQACGASDGCGGVCQCAVPNGEHALTVF